MKKAFTLAEVLITLGIIGVVAAITIPNLITNYQKRQTVDHLKKMFAVLNQAIKLSVVDHEEVSGWDFDLAMSDVYAFVEEYYFPYFKGSQLYKDSEFKVMTNNQYSIKNLNQKTSVFPKNDDMFAIIVLADGSYFITKKRHGTFYEWLFIDINGIKGPNRIGRDVFVVNIDPQWSTNKKMNSDVVFWGESYDRETLTNPGLDEETENAGYYGCSKQNIYGYYSGYYCGALIKLDNWKISKDYPW